MPARVLPVSSANAAFQRMEVIRRNRTKRHRYGEFLVEGVRAINGAVTSGFGLRWGRMHEGLDIGVGFGTPIRAAAGGTVSHAGWLGGYGNLVVVEHGGGLATAYAHQQQIYVSVGQTVSQGQLIASVGCTGHCYGPHVHFEVRVNGTPVDPMGYL